MKEPENIALFDMDGTLCDYEGTMKKCLKELASPKEKRYNFHDEKTIPDYIYARMDLIKAQPNWWTNLPKLVDGLELLKLCKAIGFDIHILTKGPKRNKNSWSEKYMWVVNNLDEDTKVTITQDKGLFYGKVLVDDWPAYIERWLEWRPRGLVIMPVRNYNKNFKHPNVIPFKYMEKDYYENFAKLKITLRKVLERNRGEKI